MIQVHTVVVVVHGVQINVPPNESSITCTIPHSSTYTVGGTCTPITTRITYYDSTLILIFKIYFYRYIRLNKPKKGATKKRGPFLRFTPRTHVYIYNSHNRSCCLCIATIVCSFHQNVHTTQLSNRFFCFCKMFPFL